MQGISIAPWPAAALFRGKCRDSAHCWNQSGTYGYGRRYYAAECGQAIRGHREEGGRRVSSRPGNGTAMTSFAAAILFGASSMGPNRTKGWTPPSRPGGFACRARAGPSSTSAADRPYTGRPARRGAMTSDRHRCEGSAACVGLAFATCSYAPAAWHAGFFTQKNTRILYEWPFRSIYMCGVRMNLSPGAFKWVAAAGSRTLCHGESARSWTGRTGRCHRSVCEDECVVMVRKYRQGNDGRP